MTKPESTPKRIPLSSSGFMQGRLQICSSNTSCLRALAVQSSGVKTTFPPLLAKLGAYNEVFYEQILKDKGIQYIREVTFTQDITNEVIARGRADFVVTAEDGNIEIHELKSASSNKTLQTVIRKGELKTDNLAQLISYMLLSKTHKGKLIYYYYTGIAEKVPTLKEQRTFKIDITEDGAILVDGEVSEFTVQQRTDHMLAQAEVLANNVVWPERPKDATVAWKGPCTYCAWNKACDMFDGGYIDSMVEFIQIAKTCVKGES